MIASAQIIAALAVLMMASFATSLRAQETSAAAQREWRDEIVYVIIVQKFCNGDATNDVMPRRYGKDKARYEGGFWGGDLAGVIQKLDYIESLGVTAILLYPVVANDAEPFGKYLATGYRPKDYFKVDENFGDLRTLKDLVARAHQRHLRVILDLPLGMAGTEHPYRRDLSKKAWFGKATPYGVPQWDAENPEVAEYLTRIAKFWRDETGCDGFRLDSVHFHSLPFWAAWSKEIKDAKHRDFILWAEVPLHPSKIGEFITATGFDTAYDFSATTASDVFGKGAEVGKLSFVLREGRQYYPSPQRMCAQLDNYEDPAFADTAHAPKDARIRTGVAFQMTLDRVPLVYTGDEAGASYRETGALFAPPLQSSPFLACMKSLIALRRKETALRRGEFAEVSARDSIYAFTRTLGSRRILVILNNSAERRQARFPIAGTAWADCALDDLLSEKPAKAVGVSTPLEMEPFGARILSVGARK
jgi:cyclomaltodextrinase / maltogenic alpha-amylase / neopullulanase